MTTGDAIRWILGRAAAEPRAPAKWNAFRISGAMLRETVVDPHQQGALNRRMLQLVILTRLIMASFAIVVLVLLWNGPLGTFPWLACAGVLVAVTALSVIAARQMHENGASAERRLCFHLVADICLLTVAMRIGGLENPFISFYMLPMVLAANALSWPLMLGPIAALAGAFALAYAFPVDPPDFTGPVHETTEMIAQSIVICFAYMAALLSRTHERRVARTREDALNRRGVQAMGSVAAQAADSISSPLSTMSVLVHELREGHLSGEEADAALRLLDQQIHHCKRNLSELLSSVSNPRGESGTKRRIDVLLRAAAEECGLMDPGLQIVFDELPAEPPQVVDERSLFDAFVLLIQHMGRFEPRHVRIAAHWDASAVTVRFSGTQPEGDVRVEDPVLPDPAPYCDGDSSIALAASSIAQFDGTLTCLCSDEIRSIIVQLPLTPAPRTTTDAPQDDSPGPVPPRPRDEAHSRRCRLPVRNATSITRSRP